MTREFHRRGGPPRRRRGPSAAGNDYLVALLRLRESDWLVTYPDGGRVPDAERPVPG